MAPISVTLARRDPPAAVVALVGEHDAYSSQRLENELTVLLDDRIRIVVDRVRLEGSVDFVGTCEAPCTPDDGARILADRPARPDLSPDPQLPDDTKLWAALVQASGGVWGGCVYDAAAVAKRLAD